MIFIPETIVHVLEKLASPCLMVDWLLFQVMKSFQLFSTFIPHNETGMTHLIS